MYPTMGRVERVQCSPLLPTLGTGRQTVQYTERVGLKALYVLVHHVNDNASGKRQQARRDEPLD